MRLNHLKTRLTSMTEINQDILTQEEKLKLLVIGLGDEITQMVTFFRMLEPGASVTANQKELLHEVIEALRWKKYRLRELIPEYSPYVDTDEQTITKGYLQIINKKIHA